MPYQECKDLARLKWKALVNEGFKYSLVAEMDGTFAGMYVIFDHHQGKPIKVSPCTFINKLKCLFNVQWHCFFSKDAIGDVIDIGDNSELMGPKIGEVLEVVTRIEHDGVSDLLKDHPPPASRQTSGVAMDPLVLATNSSLSPADNLVRKASTKKLFWLPVL